MSKKNYFIPVLFLLVSCVGFMSCSETTSSSVETAVAEEEAPSPSAELPVDHTAWDELTKAHVADGNVQYGDMKKDEAKLDTYLTMLSSTPPTDEWSSDQKLAYWINAYNAFTVKLILNNADKKLGSIKDLNTPWDNKFFEIDGKKMSLNNIEHDIIRKDFDEPRIHFVLVCAAKSCPPLMSGAYDSQLLSQQLEERTRSFLNDASLNKIEGNTAKVTSLFDWYGDDFKKGKNTVPAFISANSKYQLSENANITYMDYDWSLNGSWN